MSNLNNKTLLTAVACAWLVAAAVFVIARPPAFVAKSAPTSPPVAKTFAPSFSH